MNYLYMHFACNADGSSAFAVFAEFQNECPATAPTDESLYNSAFGIMSFASPAACVAMEMSGVTTYWTAECSAIPGAADAPCFAAEATTACRLLSPTASAAAAFDDCFGAGNSQAGERVLMTELTAGDRVLASEGEVARVLFNQHAAVTKAAPTLTITHTEGSLTLTPDHVLYADGAFVAAREVKPGSALSSGASVTAVTPSTHTVINPVTTTNTILAAGLEGAPVLSSTHPEWAAALLMESPVRLSATSALSYAFPRQVQAFYDAVMEDVNSQVAWKKMVGTADPSTMLPLLALVDLMCAAAFLVYSVASVEGMLAIATLSLTALATGKRVATQK